MGTAVRGGAGRAASGRDDLRTGRVGCYVPVHGGGGTGRGGARTAHRGHVQLGAALLMEQLSTGWVWAAVKGPLRGAGGRCTPCITARHWVARAPLSLCRAMHGCGHCGG